MKNAWRQHQQRTGGYMARLIGQVFCQGERLGSVWERLISWEVITEEDAGLLASQVTRSGRTFFDDTGAKLCLSLALGAQVEAVKRQVEAAKRGGGGLPQDLHGVVIAFLVLAAEGDPATRDDRVVRSLEGSPFTEEQIRGALQDLQDTGLYEETVKRALEEAAARERRDGEK
jgi:hypothetical protein